jgi:hypothetical protein
VELDKVKEMHAAAEKLRRERWIEEKTKKIKVGCIASSVDCSLFCYYFNMKVGPMVWRVLSRR